MALDKNILAQAEQLLQQHEQSRRNLINKIMGAVAQSAKALMFQGILHSNTIRELAVFRMMEEATDLTKEDTVELEQILSRVRAEGHAELAKHLTPEQLAEMDKNLDKSLAEMAQTTVVERQQ